MAAKGKGPQLKWTESMEETLIYLIISKGVHVAHKGNVTQKWNEVNEDLFLNECFEDHKDQYYKKGDFRMLKDKSKKIIQYCDKMMTNGNKSALPGGTMTKKFKLVKQLLDEKKDYADEKERELEEEKEEKAHLKENENSVLKGTKKGRHGKQLDGTILERADGHVPTSSSKGSTSFDMFLSASMADMDRRKQSGTVNEEQMHTDMAEWIENQGYDMTYFLLEANIRYTPVLSDETIDTLLYAYCAVGDKFGMAPFRQNMIDMGVQPNLILKLFAQLGRWRKETVADLERKNAGFEDRIKANVTLADAFQETSTPPSPLLPPAVSVEPTPLLPTAVSVEPTPLLPPAVSVEPTPLLPTDVSVEPTPLLPPAVSVEPTPLLPPAVSVVPITCDLQSLLASDNDCSGDDVASLKAAPTAKRVCRRKTPVQDRGAMCMCDCGCELKHVMAQMFHGCNKCEPIIPKYVISAHFSSYKCKTCSKK
jgi:hypothetical protein